MSSNPGKSAPSPPRATVLLTRPRHRAEAFAATLPPETPVIIAPLIEVVSLPFDIATPPRALILTSAEAVPRAASRADLAGLPAFCVGHATGEAARAAGFAAADAGGTTRELLAGAARMQPFQPLLYLRGRHQARDIATELAARGFDVAEAVVYDQRATGFDAAAMDRIGRSAALVAPVFSRRSARILADALKALPALPRIHVVALADWGEDLHVFKDLGDVSVCANPTGDSMRAAVLARLAAPPLAL